MESIYTNRICRKRTLGRPWGNLFLGGNAQGAFAGRVPTEAGRAIWYGQALEAILKGRFQADWVKL